MNSFFFGLIFFLFLFDLGIRWRTELQKIFVMYVYNLSVTCSNIVAILNTLSPLFE
jgi:hypothetical protein